MTFGVVVFPGSNCDEDAVHALSNVLGEKVVKLWHKDSDFKNIDEAWVADNSNGLVKYTNENISDVISVNSPKTNEIYSLDLFLLKTEFLF